MTTKVKSNQLKEEYLVSATPQVTNLIGGGDIEVSNDSAGTYTVSLLEEATSPDYLTPYLSGKSLDIYTRGTCAICFADDGRRGYTAAYSNTVNFQHFTFSTPYDLSTGTQVETAGSLDTSAGQFIAVSNDGTKFMEMSVSGAVTTYLWYGTMTTSYDLSTRVKVGESQISPNAEFSGLSLVNDNGRISGFWQTTLNYYYGMTVTEDFTTQFVPNSSNITPANSYRVNSPLWLRGLCFTDNGSTAWTVNMTYQRTEHKVNLMRIPLTTPYDLSTMKNPSMIHSLREDFGGDDIEVGGMSAHPNGKSLFLTIDNTTTGEDQIVEVIIGE